MIEKDEFYGYRKIPGIYIPHNINRMDEYLNWDGTPEHKIWSYLQTYIIREPVRKPGPVNIYKEYYQKGYLAARWSLVKLSKKFGYNPESGYVSKLLNKLNDKGMIKIRKHRVGKSWISVYEMGTHNFAGAEELYALKYFLKDIHKEKLKDRFNLEI
jgi:hypothetical protein